MKRSVILFVIVFLFFSTFALGESLSVKVDPKVEALSILNYIAGIEEWPQNSEFEQYKRDIDNYFIKAHNRKHPAVDMIQLLKTFGFKDEAPYLLLLHLSPEFEFMYPKKSYIQISKGIGIPTGALKEALLKKFIFEFKAFYYDYKFQEFYKEHASFYKNLENNIKDLLPIDLVSVLEGFFKASSFGYNVLLTPTSPKSYGLYIRNPYGFESFAIMDLPFIPETERAKLEYVYQIIKELVRSFVEPIDYGYTEEIKKLKKIPSYNMIQDRASTYKVVNEIIVSAVASHLMKVLYSDREEAWAIVREERNGYYLVRPLARFLEKYYKDLDKYKNFAQFYPEILSYLSEINNGKKRVDIPQNMGELLKKEAKKKGLVIVSSDSLSKEIDTYIEKIKEEYKKEGYKVVKLSEKEYMDNLRKYKNRICLAYLPADEVSNSFSRFVPPIELNRFGIRLLGLNYNGEYLLMGRFPNIFTEKGDMVVVIFNDEKILKKIKLSDYLAFNYVVLNNRQEIVQGGFQKFRIK